MSSDRQPDPVSDHGRRRWLLATAAIALVILVAAFLLTSDEIAPSGKPPETSTFVNQAGRYSIRYPVGWTATALGSAAKLTPPRKDVVIGVAPAPRGTLDDSARRVTREVLRSYEGVKVLNRTKGSIAGRDSILYVGRGRNLARTRIQWMTITLRDEGRNFAVSVFTQSETDPREVLPLLQTVVGSLEARD